MRFQISICCFFLALVLKGENMIAHWNFDNVENGVVMDKSGKGHDGKIFGNVRFVDGVKGRAARFGSNDDYIDFGAPIIPEDDFTVCLWINCDDIEKQFFLGQYKYLDSSRLDLAVRNGCARIQIDKIVDSPRKIQKGKWHHLAYSRKGDKVDIYIDGELVKSSMLPNKVTQKENLILGKIFVPDRDSFRFVGAIDELMIFSKALPSERIKEIFGSKLK